MLNEFLHRWKLLQLWVLSFRIFFAKQVKIQHLMYELSFTHSGVALCEQDTSVKINLCQGVTTVIATQFLNMRGHCPSCNRRNWGVFFKSLLQPLSSRWFARHMLYRRLEFLNFTVPPSFRHPKPICLA